MKKHTKEPREQGQKKGRKKARRTLLWLCKGLVFLCTGLAVIGGCSVTSQARCKDSLSFRCPKARPVPAKLAALLRATPTKATKGKAGKKPRFLRVLTFNVNYGAVNPRKSIARILASKADLVALQEVTVRWAFLLRHHLRKHYPHMLFRHTNGGDLAFLSKFPLRSRKQMRPPKGGWFPAWWVEAATPLGLVQVLNLHLRPALGESGKASSVVSAYFSTPKIRLREVRTYLKQVKRLIGKKKAGPLLVLGDFNEGDNGLSVRWLATQHKMKDALRNFDRNTPTWYWPTSLVTLRGRLDRIMYTPQLRCIYASVLPDAASDHFPVTAIFTTR